VAQNGADDAEKLVFIKSIWTSAQPLRGSIAEHIRRRRCLPAVAQRGCAKSACGHTGP
jgi:hypothetical protein